MYVTYTVQSASAPSMAGQYGRTRRSPGAPPKPNDATTFLMNNFTMDFPAGVTNRDEVALYAHFTSAAAVAAILPQAGAPSALIRNFSNPTDWGTPSPATRWRSP